MGLDPVLVCPVHLSQLQKADEQRDRNRLSIITSSYLRSESIITAVEEKIHYLNPPVADVFRGFLAETGMISADVEAGPSPT